jgi:uncharacterized protein YjaZ
MPVTTYVTDATGSLTNLRDQLHDAVSNATSMTSSAIDVDDVDVVFYDEPNDTIPEWGIGGTTMGKHLVLVAVDPSRQLVAEYLHSTLVHELHHAMRWRVATLSEDLGDMLASEGLAVLLESELIRAEPFYAKVDVLPVHVELATTHLYDRPCNTGRWFFGTADVPKSFGYSLGYQMCRRYAEASGKNARELLVTPTNELIAGLPLVAQ